MIDLTSISMSISGLKNHFNNGDFSPRELILELLAGARAAQALEQNGVWIHLLSEAEIEPYLSRLDGMATDLPLYGIPFAIKDNIDLAQVATTAACPDFAYLPECSAFVVEQLLNAGAIPLGKTNLDQFATGLVGVRSPYGACKNAFDPSVISGGSSSGSAVAVARHWVTFALGTDTAGSGRVPAALNNVVGLKPSRGLLSNRGLVPACRSLDCISLFALTVADANQILDIAAVFDPLDCYARKNPFGNGARYGAMQTEPFVVGVPMAGQLAFFGDTEAPALFANALASVRECGGELIEIDFQPFIDAAKLLYDGPWVTERYIAARALMDARPESVLPVIRGIIEKGATMTSVMAFEAQYQLQQCLQNAEAVFASVDCIITPTIGTDYSIAEVESNPVELNSNLGYYTNYMNLLDCAALAVPTGFKSTGVGFGVTLFHRAFQDKRLVALGRALQQQLAMPAGLKQIYESGVDIHVRTAVATIDLVVCGAHLMGEPLNWQLQERGAVLLEQTWTSNQYRLYALAGGPPQRPGLARSIPGAAIEVEVWRVPLSDFGSFVAEIPRPLGIGKLELEDGRWLSGFICEQYALNSATDITEFGSWRAYINEK